MAAFVLIGIAAVLYSVLVAQRLLFGTGIAFAFFVIAFFVYYGGINRPTLTRTTIVVTLMYGVFTLELPVAVIAACIVYLTAWLTGSDSPFDAPDTEIFPAELG
ncbi:hypothetical protein [Natronomonas sp.]|uniref:hypothetical protein n=1 Tax=Natronomonas sp. TaxID=2184060 RepID=UPI003975A8B0